MKASKAVSKRLQKFALSFPSAYEDHPWGEVVAKVNKKVFVFFGTISVLSITVKLPKSSEFALSQPFATPTGYGLGKSGWVTLRFETGDDVPVEMLRGWIEESYRAVAPKKFVAELDSR